jgi:hypothetical protein
VLFGIVGIVLNVALFECYYAVSSDLSVLTCNSVRIMQRILPGELHKGKGSSAVEL